MAHIIHAPVFNSAPARKWSGDPVYPNVASLPTATPPPQNLFDGVPPPRRLPPVQPVRRQSVPVPARDIYFEGPPQKRWPGENVAAQITALLPTIVTQPLDWFDGVPPPKRLPPHMPVDRRGNPLASALTIGNIFDGSPPPRKLPPHMPVRVNINQVPPIIPSVLSQLQTEFDQTPPIKRYPETVIYQNFGLLIAPVVPPPPHGPEYPSKLTVRWPEDAAAPNVAIQPLMIQLAQQEIEYDYQGLPPKRWPDVPNYPNVIIQPIAAVNPPIITFEYPAKARIQWTEEAVAPVIANLPTAQPITPYEDVLNTWPRRFYTEEAASPNIGALPVKSQETSRAVMTYWPKKIWPDTWTPPNVLQTFPPDPPPTGMPLNYQWPKPAFIRLDSWVPQPQLVTPVVPIYIPVIGYEIFIPYRTFALAIPARAFALTIPYRTFTVSLSPLLGNQSMQTFDVKHPLEEWPLSFNMAPDLFAGETLTGAPIVTVELQTGADPDPSAIINGLPGFDPTSTQVIQPVQGGTNGCSYRITVTCATTNPNKTLTLVGILPVLIQ